MLPIFSHQKLKEHDFELEIFYFMLKNENFSRYFSAFKLSVFMALVSITWHWIHMWKVIISYFKEQSHDVLQIKDRCFLFYSKARYLRSFSKVDVKSCMHKQVF